MRGFVQHLRLGLRLNFRSPQALVYGYLVPIFFLIAFGSIFKTVPPMFAELGQLITITTLGGACFGMPTAMVAERERGVWRRYKLLPAGTGGFVLSTMLARFVLVATAALLQIALARLIYHTPMPEHPWQMLTAFCFVSFAFLAMGLVIAMLAENVPSVQALGQAIFLPMIIVGGVGVPLAVLPRAVQPIASFLPGRYAVDALQACVDGNGLAAARFDLLALLLIGLAALLAGAKMFRWDAQQKLAVGAKAWAILAVVAWIGVGAVALRMNILREPPTANRNGGVLQIVEQTTTPPTTGPSTGLSTGTSTGQSTSPSGSDLTNASSNNTSPTSAPAVTATSAPTTGPADWQSVTPADSDSITYDDLEPDNSTVTPIAPSFKDIPEDNRADMDELAGKLAEWKPALSKDPVTRVRNLLSVCAVPDILEDPNESYIPLVVFEQIKGGVSQDQLIKILTWIELNPDEGTYLSSLPELGFPNRLDQTAVRGRAEAYGKKLLARLLGKYHPERVGGK